jgi:hypothetical protein
MFAARGAIRLRPPNHQCVLRQRRCNSTTAAASAFERYFALFECHIAGKRRANSKVEQKWQIVELPQEPHACRILRFSSVVGGKRVSADAATDHPCKVIADELAGFLFLKPTECAL